MKSKIYFLFSILLLSALTINAQKVKLKDNKIYVDGEYLMDCDTRDHLQEFFLIVDGEDEVMITWDDNGTSKYPDDDWMTFFFINMDLKVETTKGRGRKGSVKWLLENKVITPEGKIDEEKAQLFFKKYDEQITERTLRH